MEFLVTQIDEIHYNGEKVGYQCFDGTGQSVKVKKGRDGYLKAKWDELQVGRAYSFTMGEFQGKPFVKDFKAMSDALDVDPKIISEAKRLGAEVESVEPKPATKGNPQNRSYALSYAKDLAVGNSGMTTDKVIEVARRFAQYLDTGV